MMESSSRTATSLSAAPSRAALAFKSRTLSTRAATGSDGSARSAAKTVPPAARTRSGGRWGGRRSQGRSRPAERAWRQPRPGTTQAAGPAGTARSRARARRTWCTGTPTPAPPRACSGGNTSPSSRRRRSRGRGERSFFPCEPNFERRSLIDRFFWVHQLGQDFSVGIRFDGSLELSKLGGLWDMIPIRSLLGQFVPRLQDDSINLLVPMAGSEDFTEALQHHHRDARKQRFCDNGTNNSDRHTPLVTRQNVHPCELNCLAVAIQHVLNLCRRELDAPTM